MGHLSRLSEVSTPITATCLISLSLTPSHHISTRLFTSSTSLIATSMAQVARFEYTDSETTVIGDAASPDVTTQGQLVSSIYN